MPDEPSMPPRAAGRETDAKACCGTCGWPAFPPAENQAWCAYHFRDVTKDGQSPTSSREAGAVEDRIELGRRYCREGLTGTGSAFLRDAEQLRTKAREAGAGEVETASIRDAIRHDPRMHAAYTMGLVEASRVQDADLAALRERLRPPAGVRETADDAAHWVCHAAAARCCPECPATYQTRAAFVAGYLAGCPRDMLNNAPVHLAERDADAYVSALPPAGRREADDTALAEDAERWRFLRRENAEVEWSGPATWRVVISATDARPKGFSGGTLDRACDAARKYVARKYVARVSAPVAADAKEETP